MVKPAKYTIFKTKWGFFGLAANKKGLLRTCLPCPNRHFIKHRLLAGLDNPQFEKNLLKPLQDEIIAYFEGKQTLRHQSSVICFLSSVPIALDGLAPFVRKVLTACRKVPSGKTVSYSQLAEIIGKPGASRAVGNALAKNPIPLIIPCHRVIRHDGSLGNFSAIGGTILKKRLLTLERS
ncbi:MAG: methylated-DNA--[protein]-cysteine S-methyltransferase [Sedimentisphaerales bacterium]|nr:methylated-DNA--[protein]-cysteine S-methyltransferase [Sedimentisphaerales bacterium]